MKNPLHFRKFLSAACSTAVVLLLGACADSKDGGAASGAPADSIRTTESGRKALVTPTPRKLKLCDFVVEPGEAHTTVTNAYAWITRSGNKLNKLEEIVDTTSLGVLERQLITAHDHTCNSFVVALKIFIGLNGNALKLYYRPVYLCSQSTTANQDATFSVTEASTNYSVYTAGNFQEATDAATRFSEYQTNITFKDGTGTRPFDQGEDTEAAIMPIQKLIAIVKHNAGDTRFKIWHYAVELPGVPNPVVRQTLLTGSEKLETPYKKDKQKGLFIFAGFTDKFANHSHLCPPRCNTLTLIMSDGSQPDCQN